jgi:hypothetical protein
LSIDDVKALIWSLFPVGFSTWADTSPGSDLDLEIEAMAEALLDGGYDLISSVEAESNPVSLTTLGLPDWERALGISNTVIARTGTEAQRRSWIIAHLRSRGTPTRSLIRAVIGPILGYPETQIQNLVVMECDRSALRDAHTYAFAAGAIPPSGGGTYLETVTVPDNNIVSLAGAQFYVNITHPAIEDVRVRADGPSGTPHTLADYGDLGTGAVVAQQYLLYCKAAAGEIVNGAWRLIVDDQGATGGDVNASTTGVFVEGMGRQYWYDFEGLGGVIFEWGVYADPDFDAARTAMLRIRPAHTLPVLIIGNDVDGECCIPDISLPGASIPCA